MITNDSSGDDWFYKPKQDGNPVKGPRPELIKEMRQKAGVGFYLYLRLMSFMKKANEFLKLDEPVPESAISEARSSGRRLSAGPLPIDFFLKDSAATAAALRASLVPNVGSSFASNEIIRNNLAAIAQMVHASMHPTVDAVNTYYKGITDQFFKNTAYDTNLYFGAGTSRRRIQTRDQEDWDDGSEGDDVEDDDSTDDPESDPKPMEE